MGRFYYTSAKKYWLYQYGHSFVWWAVSAIISRQLDFPYGVCVMWLSRSRSVYHLTRAWLLDFSCLVGKSYILRGWERKRSWVYISKHLDLFRSHALICWLSYYLHWIYILYIIRIHKGYLMRHTLKFHRFMQDE